MINLRKFSRTIEDRSPHPAPKFILLLISTVFDQKEQHKIRALHRYLSKGCIRPALLFSHITRMSTTFQKILSYDKTH